MILLILLGCTGGVSFGWAATAFGVLPSIASTSPSTESQRVENIPASPTTLPVHGQTLDLQSQIEAVFEHVGPSVVNITSRSVEFDFFLRPVPREGSGSGFFYDQQGHIITNYHVIQGADELQVALADGQTLVAQVIGSDPSNDLAVLRVEMPAGSIPIVPTITNDELKVGQFVIAIGNPFGLAGTLTVGVVSSLGRVINSPNERFIGEAIQTDAAINPGNSGGPLLNLAGEVVGVNSAILSPSGASAGIGFAIPVRTVQRVVPALIRDGHYPHPSLNAEMVELTPSIVRLLEFAGMDASTEQGILLIQLHPGGAAEQAGLRGATHLVRVHGQQVPIGGDILIAINNEPIATLQDLIVYLETQTEVGQMVSVTLVRDGREMTVDVQLGALEHETP